ncbi:MAG: CCA tRNA nucleotidyltransferase [Planctomycetota bacterium]
MTESAQRRFAREVVAALREAGHEALWAGGCVRDALLGKTPKDYDIATGAEPEQVQTVFGRRRTIPVGASFGVITVLGPRGVGPIEVATFRADGKYVDGRRPETVRFTTAEEDAQRRDFTINGLFYDPVEDRVIDYVGGQDDLRAKTLRAIGDPAARFAEDKLRMLRAARFATTLEFEIEPATMAAIRGMADQLSVVSAERIGSETSRLLTHPHAGRGLALLGECGLLATVFPELAAWAAADSTEWRAAGERLEALGGGPLPTALAATLLELPKVDTPAVGRRLRLTKKDAADAGWLIESVAVVEAAEGLPWSRLQPWLADPRAAELLKLSAAALGEGHAGLVRCRAELGREREQLDPPPLVSGSDVLGLGYPPGPGIAAALKSARDGQLDGRLATKEQALEHLRRGLPGGRDSASE